MGLFRRFISQFNKPTTRPIRRQKCLEGLLTTLEDRVTPSVADWAEPNQSRQDAVYLGRTNLNWSGLSIDTATDNDWFSFRIDATGQTGNKVGIVQALSNRDLDIELYNSAGSFVTGSYSSSASEFVSLAGRPAGVYFLRVFGYAGSTGDYSFQLQGPTPADNGDFTEFNDVPGNAFTIPARSGGFNMFGMNINTNKDVDWYYLRLANKGTTADFAKIDFTHSAGDLDMQLFSESNTSTPISSSTSTSNTENISLNGLAAGNYYLRVFGYQGAVNLAGYGMTLNLPLPSSGPVGDWAETNNSISTATNLGQITTLTTKTSLSIHDKLDNDYFRFQLANQGSASDYVSIDFSHAAGDLDLQLLNAAGVVIGSSGTVADSEKISLAGLLPNTDYLVRVFGWAGATNNNYTLKISPPPAITADAKEQNDTIATATDLGLSGTNIVAIQSNLSIHNSKDVDYFKVNLVANGTSATSGRIDFISSQGNLDLQLFSANGTLLKTSTGLSNSEQISFEGLSSGTYFLAVVGASGSTNPQYTLTVTGPLAAQGDRYEPNNTVPTATDLGQIRGTPQPLINLSIHNSTDRDYFAFTTAGTSQDGHFVQINFEHSKGDLDIALRDSAGGLISGRSSTGVTNTEKISLAGLPAGKYYLDVYGYNGAVNQNYTVTFSTPQSGWQPDRLEPNDSKTAATQLRTATGTESKLSIHSSTDTDWFQVVTTGTGNTNNFARITYNAADGKLGLNLLDANGNVLASGSAASNAVTVSLANRPAGTYYVQVVGIAGSTNLYDLSWNAPIGNLPTASDAWTIMVYMNSSNLPSKADINEMETAIANGLPGSVNITVYLDQNNAPSNPAFAAFPTGNGSQAAWTSAGYGVVVADKGSSIATPFQIIGERNTGDPNTLADFIRWSKQNAPAQRYALVMWDHGGGIRFGTNGDDEGGGVSNYDSLTVNEIVQGIQSSGVPLSVLAFDMCLMGMAEVTYALRDSAPVIVASEENIDGPGFDYTTAFSSLMTNPQNVSNDQFASGLVSSFQNQYVRPGNNLDTLAAIRSSKMAGVATAVQNFVNVVGTSPSSAVLTALRTARDQSSTFADPDSASFGYRDLGQFMNRVATNTSLPQALRDAANGVRIAIQDTIIAKTQDRRGTSGLSIYIPASGQTYDTRYTQNSMGSVFTLATGWNRVAQQIAAGNTGRSNVLNSLDFFESNDSAGLASDLGTMNGFGNEISGLNLHTSSDEDYFRFTAVAGGTFSVQAFAQTGEALQVQFLSDTESLLGSNVGQNPTVTTTVTADTTYLVRVLSGNGQAVTSYSLQINAPENRNSSGTAGSNDSQERAYNLGTISGQQMFTGFVLANPGESDWYTFSTPRLDNAQPLELRVLFNSVDPVEVYLEDSTQSFTSQSSGTSDTSISFSVDAGQTFRLRVSNSTNNLVPYSLSFRGVSQTNTEPSISAINSIVLSAGQVLNSLPLNLFDLETPTELTLFATSSNPAIVPESSIFFGGTGANKTLSIIPSSGATGNSTITLVVQDPSGAARSQTFNVTVLPPNVPPITVPPITLPNVPPINVPNIPSFIRDLTIGTQQIAVGSDRGSGQVRFLSQNRGELFSLTPFAGFTGGVRTASADFNRDGVADVVAGTGPGIATRVVIIDGKTQQTLFDLAPFEAAFVGGVYVATGDLNGDGIPDLAISPDEGGGPRVRIFSGAGFTQLADFFGIEDPNFRGGARVAFGDVTGDGKGELIMAAGFGGGPRIAVWDASSLVNGKLTNKPFADFFAFEDSLRNGSFITVGDVTGDQVADLVFGGGPGGGPRVRVFDGKQLRAAGSFRTLDEVASQSQIANFFAGSAEKRGGVRLAVKDLDNDNLGDIVTAAGEGDGSQLLGFLGKNVRNGRSDFELEAFGGFLGGAFVG